MITFGWYLLWQCQAVPANRLWLSFRHLYNVMLENYTI